MSKVRSLLKSVPSATWAGIAIMVFFAIVIDGYLGGRNIMNILKSASVLAIASIGMTYVILLGEIDMSVGGVMTVAATASGMYLNSLETTTAANVIIASLICVGIGVAFGLFDGFMIGIKKFNFWLVTFGSMSMGYGLASGITGGSVVSGFDKKFQWIASGELFGISMCIIWAVIAAIIAIVILYHTKFGFHIFAMGDAESCAVNSGINTKRTRFWVYTLSGLFSGIAALVLIAKTNSAGATVGDGYEFNAIAAVVIGGTAMEGGKGGYKGTIFGAIFIAAMKNGLQLIGLSNYWQQVLLGVVIVAIILYDVINAKVRAKKNLRRVYSEG